MRSFVGGPGDFESCLLVISVVPSIGSGLFLILLSLGPVTYDQTGYWSRIMTTCELFCACGIQ